MQKLKKKLNPNDRVSFYLPYDNSKHYGKFIKIHYYYDYIYDLNGNLVETAEFKQYLVEDNLDKKCYYLDPSVISKIDLDINCRKDIKQ
jgi:hypothetical protein